MASDFKRVVKDIAEQIDDIPKLAFMCDEDYANIKSGKLTALDILWRQVIRGSFSHDNIKPLEQLMKDIDRYDLIAKYINPHEQTYMKPTTSIGPGKYFGMELCGNHIRDIISNQKWYAHVLYTYSDQTDHCI